MCGFIKTEFDHYIMTTDIISFCSKFVINFRFNVWNFFSHDAFVNSQIAGGMSFPSNLLNFTTWRRRKKNSKSKNLSFCSLQIKYETRLEICLFA